MPRGPIDTSIEVAAWRQLCRAPATYASSSIDTSMEVAAWRQLRRAPTTYASSSIDTSMAVAPWLPQATDPPARDSSGGRLLLAVGADREQLKSVRLDRV